MRDMVRPDSPDSERSAVGVASDTARHYVETVFYIRFEEGHVRPGRLAEWLGLRAPTVTVTLQRLARDGWLTVGPDHTVSLTTRGEQLAALVVRTHRLLERWLTDVLHLDWASADEEAQRLAPGVSAEVADRLDESLGRPATCPHGNLVPGRQPPYGELVSLADLVPGSPAKIRRISEVAEHDAPELLRQLDAMGLRTGTLISVAPTHPSLGVIAVEAAGEVRSIGTQVARLIWVEPGSATD